MKSDLPARRRRGLPSWLGLLLALALSVGVHLSVGLLAALTGALSMFGRVHVPPKPSAVTLRAMAPGMWAANRTERPPGQKPPPQQQQAQNAPEPKKPEVKKEVLPEGKVVATAPGNNEKPDDDARFLAESNNRVKKETISRDRTLDYKNATAKPSTTVKPSDGGEKKAADEQVIAGNGGKAKDETPQREGKKKKLVLDVPTVEKRDRLALKLDGLGGRYVNRDESDSVQGNAGRLKVQMGDGDDDTDVSASSGASGGKPELKTLSPSSAVLDKIAGAPAADVGRLDDVEEGDGTFLNTKEWKFSSFFNRIKQSVGQHWDPNTVVRRHDPTGEVYLYKDRYTIVKVTLDSRGLVKDIYVDKTCGVDFLDEEAVAAFQRAQPFPNPPQALANDAGEVHFTFGFFLEVSKGSLRLFRQAN